MKNLLVQDYLLSGKTLEDLKVEHGVYHNITNGKVGLTYDMLEAKESDPIACECRGLILRAGTFERVAVPFFRFFNYQQEGLIPKSFDWKSASYHEKADGTLIIIYHDAILNKWMCGTRSRPEADGNVDGGEHTFASLVEYTCRLQFKNEQIENLNDLMNTYYSDCKDYTFCFEFVSPYNRIVCKYEVPTLYLLMVRNNITLQEEDPTLYSARVPLLNCPPKYNFNNVAHSIEVINTWNPENHEGVVIIDKNFSRIKLKNPAYVMYNHMRDSLSSSSKNCIEIVLMGREDDVAPMMPELIGKRIMDFKNKIQKLFLTVENDYDRIKSIDDMKEFAFAAQKCLWTAPLFAIKRGKVKDLKEFVHGKNFDGLSISGSMLGTIEDLCGKMSL